MPGKTRVPKRVVKEEVPKMEPERAIIPRADAPPSDDEDSIDQDIISQGYHLFNISDDETEAYDDYKYQGKYVIPQVSDEKWRHARAKDRVTLDMGINELAQVVGSKRARDIRRRGHFMSPEAFDAWQEKYDPKKRYSYDERDLDDDKKNEFIIEHTDRYGKKKLVAVNGWTTAKSDYPLRKEYYDLYPTHEQRKANKFKPWLSKKYLTEENLDDYGFPNHKYLEERSIKAATSKFDWHMPTFNARGEFMKRVIWDAYRVARDTFVESGAEPAVIQNKCNEAFGHGWVVKLGGRFWKSWILDPFMAALRDTQYYATAMQDYASKFKRNVNGKLVAAKFDAENPEHIEMFEKTLMKKDTARLGLNAEVRGCLNDTEELKRALHFMSNIFINHIDKALNQKSAKGSPPRQAVAKRYA